MIGRTIGPYQILAELGRGGMGEVYRARDTTLNREVALKILPESVAADPERIARFKREAQVLASLNHPNIAALYGIEQHAGDTRTALVMELVDGQDLSVHISREPLALSEALPIARQVLDALESAHEQGVVHRDLKPQNIKVREDGTVKVLDFGLAKALSQPGEDAQLTGNSANSPTLTARATQMGTILGTAAYMSPEQARGRAIDKRTDVWAFGCVLYEMLTARKAFDGEDATEIISSVVKSDPDLNALPVSLRTIVARCLAKDRKARIPDVSVVRYLLDDALSASSSPVVSAVPARSRWIWPAVAAVLALISLATGIAWYRGRTVEPASAKFTVLPPAGTLFSSGAFSGATLGVISPNGRTLAFTAQDASGKRLLYVRQIDALGAQPVTGTDGASFPFWSPDSSMIGYAVTGRLMRVALSGGPPLTICTLNPGIVSRGAAWNKDGDIIFNNGPATLYRARATGSAAEAVGKLAEGQNGRQFPSFLPDGRHFLFHASGPTASGLYLGSLDSDETTRLMSSESGAIYDSQTGHLLFVREGTLFAQAFDVGSRSLSGDSKPIAEHVESAAVPGLVTFSISHTGVLAYGVGHSAGSGYRLTWVNRQGKSTGTLGPEGQYRGVALSPDGSQLAAHRHDGDGGDIWLIETARNAPGRLTLDPAQENSSPVWSPGGDRIAFQSTRNGRHGIYVRSSNGPGQDERIIETTGLAMVPLSWSHDGKTLLFAQRDPKTSMDMWTVALDGQGRAVPRIQTTANEFSGQYSPDGRWLAYQSTETGPSEIYVQSASSAGRRWTISTAGGNAPRWRGDSRELFYIGGGKLWAVEIAVKGDLLAPGQPTALFDYRGLANSTHPAGFFSYDVTRDGQRFLMTRREVDSGDDPAATPIVVVFNWQSALKRQ